jgi:hypothetical protein
MPAILVAAVATAASICAKNDVSLVDLRSKMVSEIVPFSDRRSELVKLLQKGEGGRCRESLQQFVSSAASGKEKEIDSKGRLTLILLAVSGSLTDSSSVLAHEVASGRGNELLDTLRSVDEPAYERTLREWMASTARELRDAQAMRPTGDAAYGRATVSADAAEREGARILNPLMMERRLSLAIERKSVLSMEELADMNAIFAGSAAAYRDVFAPLYGSVLKTNVSTWIASFRKESAWVQTRLFPLMTRVGGPEVVRELMWLADNHADLRIRALAERSLDEILKVKKSR